VETNASGSYTVDYQVRDRAGLTTSASRSVLVADRTPPEISIIGANPKTVECGTVYHDDGTDAADSCDGDLTGAVLSNSHVNTNSLGSYTVDYQVRDKAGLTAATSRSVLVVDRAPPVVTIKPMMQLFPPDDLYRTFSLANCAQATDACSGALDLNQVGEIVAIYSDEPDVIRSSDPGNDIVILGSTSFNLRNQMDKRSNGRVYEIEFTTRDNHGNKSTARSCFIGVKASQSSAQPVSDGRIFTVRP
jgi:hypothetical protein